MDLIGKLLESIITGIYLVNSLFILKLKAQMLFKLIYCVGLYTDE